MDKKLLSLGLSDFRDLIEGNYIYVDKTKWIYELVKPPKGLYFLSRPRRFGKTLTVSTLYYLFKGEKRLFKGMYIYDKWDFKPYPVLKLDMTKVSPDLGHIERSLTHYLNRLSKQHNVTVSSDYYSDIFNDLIEELSKRGEVVVLVDEYDAPMLHNITKSELPRIREIMAQFYVQLKNNQDKVHLPDWYKQVQ